jgi:hypothetical protein
MRFCQQCAVLHPLAGAPLGCIRLAVWRCFTSAAGCGAAPELLMSLGPAAAADFYKGRRSCQQALKRHNDLRKERVSCRAAPPSTDWSASLYFDKGWLAAMTGCYHTSLRRLRRGPQQRHPSLPQTWRTLPAMTTTRLVRQRGQDPAGHPRARLRRMRPQQQQGLQRRQVGALALHDDAPDCRQTTAAAADLVVQAGLMRCQSYTI